MSVDTETPSQYVSSSTGGSAPTPTKWYVVLHIENGVVTPQLDWSKSMKVGDEVYFLSPDGKAQVKFVPEECATADNIPITKIPFDREVIVGDLKTPYKVVNSCKSLMICSVILPDKRVATWSGVQSTSAAWPTAEDEKGGTHVCTGGGTQPVVCS